MTSNWLRRPLRRPLVKHRALEFARPLGQTAQTQERLPIQRTGGDGLFERLKLLREPSFLLPFAPSEGKPLNADQLEILKTRQNRRGGLGNGELEGANRKLPLIIPEGLAAEREVEHG